MALDPVLIELEGMLSPIIQEMGYDLIELELSPQMGRLTLRLYIDRPEGIIVDDCGAVSRAVSPLLEEKDPIKKRYDLEVSSPGMERPLRRKCDFEKFCGSSVRIRTEIDILGRKNFRGKLCRVEGDSVVVDVDGTEYNIPITTVVKARIVA